MTLFASTALYRRGDGRGLAFKAPRKEVTSNATQARKAASRYWGNRIEPPDQITRIAVVRWDGRIVHVAEKADEAAWIEYGMQPAEAARHPHIAACLAELGIDPARSPPPMPDTLEINGVVYRREI